MDVFKLTCDECPYTFEIQRKYGKTIHCKKDPTKMDVTYFCNEKHKGEKNRLCPLRQFRKKNEN